MANTYTQMHLQFIFAVKYRKTIIHPSWKDELYKYITGVIRKNGHKTLAINGVSDHIHILVGMRPDQSVADLLQDIKSASSKWINDNKFVKHRFEWQSGYGAFSYARTEINKVIDYIKNQEVHHNQISFKEEYINMLNSFEVVFEEKYLFETEEELV